MRLYIKSLGYDVTNLNFKFNDKNNATMMYYYDTGEGNSVLEVDLKVNYLTDVRQEEFDSSNKILSNFKEEDRLYGLQLINLIYHYGRIEDDDYANDAIFARYSKFKKVMDLNPEYKYVSNGGRGGGDPVSRHRVIQAGVFKDGIMYGIKQLDHYEEQILFVDKDATGTLEEKVEARLNKYFNDKVNVDVKIDYDSKEEFDNETFNTYVNNLLGVKNLILTGGYQSTITINGTEILFVVVEVPSEYLDNLCVESYDNETGVNIRTDSYDVPIDARVKAKDVKDNKDLKDLFIKENLIVDAAYDISLIKSFDGTFINEIDKGIEVYLPVVEKYKVGDKPKIYYVTDNSSEKEIYHGEIVKIDNKNYVKLITNHFSTYVLVSEALFENPKTFDNIINVISIGCLLLVGIIFCFNINKKEV